MGMYTGLRCKIVVNEEFSPVIKRMMEDWLDWNDLYQEFPQYNFLSDFGNGYRANSIPYGSLSYMPDEWENVPVNQKGKKEWLRATPTEGFDKEFNEESRIWSFQCSLKNYEDDIGRFFELVLPKITEKVIHLEKYYEESASSTFYELDQGKIVQSDKEGIVYKGYLIEEEDRWY